MKFPASNRNKDILNWFKKLISNSETINHHETCRKEERVFAINFSTITNQLNITFGEAQENIMLISSSLFPFSGSFLNTYSSFPLVLDRTNRLRYSRGRAFESSPEIGSSTAASLLVNVDNVISWIKVNIAFFENCLSILDGLLSAVCRSLRSALPQPIKTKDTNE